MNRESVSASDPPRLLLENRHTGERLTISRIWRGEQLWFSLAASLPPHREGPPMHVHFAEDEEGIVSSRTLSAVIQGATVVAGTGQSVFIPAERNIAGGSAETTR